MKRNVFYPVYFIVDGSPVGKERPRMGRRGRFYTPQKTVDFENRVAWALKDALSRAGLVLSRLSKQGEVATRIVCHFVDKRHPDLDNVLKAAWDGISKATGWNDKNFECDGLHKVYGDREFTELWLRWQQ